MNAQTAMHTKPSANGIGRRRVDREITTRSENRLHPGRTNSGRLTNAMSDGRVGVSENVSRDRLLYITTCFIGHPVEVQVKDGSLYAGIFHATDAERDFGIILKSARLVKDSTLRGQKAFSDFASKIPSKSLIIPAKELVQVIAKDVAVTSEAYTNELNLEKGREILTDTTISQSRHVEMGRELAPWIPDADDPQCPDLENVFDKQWNRGWDQFEANEVLFGVRTTYDEELYTTKLEKGPQMRELEREAIRIAREIEGEETQDLHVAEERGLEFNEKYDIDEETRYSSVYRHQRSDDSGYGEEEEDILLESRNGESSKSFASTSWRPDPTSVKSSDGEQCGAPGNQANVNLDKNHSCTEDLSISFKGKLAVELRKDDPVGSFGMQTLTGDLAASNVRESQPVSGKPSSSDKIADVTNMTPSDLSLASEKVNTKGAPIGVQVPGNSVSEAHTKSSSGRPGSSSGSEHVTVSSGLRLSPSSSVGSLSSEKSTLNPNAKEFKLNPNAKSFKPSHSAARPPSPASDSSFYYPAGVSPMPPLHGMSVGFGMGPTFPGHQSVMYNPQMASIPTPQGYFHPNGHQYGQQMLLGHPRQVVYMPTYQPEMPYKG